MPIKIPSALPARETLENENIFVMDEYRALHQDIRPLRIAILNLMPTKITTETQLIRVLSNTSLQIELTLLNTATHESKNTPAEHMAAFYKSFYDVQHENFDGLIVTGAPVEELPYEQVDYWPELCLVMDWAKTHVFSSFFICWAAQAALYHYYGVPKYPTAKKVFGVFEHRLILPTHPLVRGFDETFRAPHSRHTGVRKSDIGVVPSLKVIAESELAGPYLICDDAARRVFVTGHSEYDYDTLSKEYFRDRDKGLPIEVPYHYFPDDDPAKTPENVWRAHAQLLYSNWLNHFVYQLTPYDLNELK